jgi:hypothetical protein
MNCKDDVEEKFIKDWNEGKVRRVSDGKRMVPEREWQGLTDGEREQIEIKANDKSEMTAWEYAHRVGNFTEAKLKEKNSG